MDFIDFRGPVDVAVDRAIHRVDPDRIHARLTSTSCPYCDGLSRKFSEAFKSTMSDTELGRDLRLRMQQILERQDLEHE